MGAKTFRFLSRTTLLLISGLWIWANTPIWNKLEQGVIADRILIQKSKHTLSLYESGFLLKTYRIALGESPKEPKRQQGDRRTPQGTYEILQHQETSSYHRALRISYPSPSDIAYAQKRGVSPGGDIMIHGMRNGFKWIGRLHRFYDWTAGCMALTNAEIDELWSAVPDGTIVEIVP